MRSITLTAPAKINLFLKVLNKRKDGYHNISTLFERISLADKITLTRIHSGIELRSDRFITADPRDNIAYKAAELILNNRKTPSGVRINIKKNIPIAAGLGGGSSDAAAVLKGLNDLFSLGLNKNKLISLGKKLGADVPFFLFGSPYAIGTGTGSVLTHLKTDITLWHIIIYSSYKTATRDIYEAFDSRAKGFRPRPKCLTNKTDDAKIPRHLTGSFDLKLVEEMLCNDLEDVAVYKDKCIKDVIERLASSLGKKAILSGSGPSVFCLYRTGKEALKAKEKLFKDIPVNERKNWQVFISRTLN